MPVRWGDLDALNHVNNTVYLRYLEEARAQVLGRAGIGVGGRKRNIFLAHLACDFLRPLGWPAQLRIDMKIQRVGRTSLEYVAEIHVEGDDGGPFARALNVIVAIDAGTRRPSPWTEGELESLAGVFVQGGA
jgi:acyl-CoA thioester hydrolase